MRHTCRKKQKTLVLEQPHGVLQLLMMLLLLLEVPQLEMHFLMQAEVYILQQVEVVVQPMIRTQTGPTC